MSAETKAPRPTMDALETTYDYTMVSKVYGLNRPYNSPILASYPADAKEKAAAVMTFWTIFRNHVLVAQQKGAPVEGLLEKYHYGNGAENYGFKKWRPEERMSPDKYEKELERWQKILKETGRKGR